MSETVHFSIDGGFVTDLAREKLFMEKDLGAAIRLLQSVTMTDQLSQEEHLMLCLQILNGDAWIKGTSGTDSYGVDFRDDIDESPTDLSDIIQLVLDMKEENDRLEKENHDLQLKFAMACEKLPEYKLDDLNTEWYTAYDEPMFADREIPSWKRINVSYIDDSENKMLGAFLEQRKREDEAEAKGEPFEEYGWLAPDGEFFPVPFGGHSGWAREWLEENKPFRDNPALYYMVDDNGTKHHIVCNDVMIYSLGWVLLENPWQGPAKVTRDLKRDYTKEQKEFLFDYFTKRGRDEEASRLYED